MTQSDPDFGSATDFYTFAPETLAEALPAFEILREVGKGSMGIVYEATRKVDGRRVALKVLPPSLTLTERALARFLREGEIMSRVEHPSIVRVFDLGRRGRLHYFVMEFVEGVNLDKRLEVGPLPVRQAAEAAAEVGRALHFAHDRGVVHRDVKPSNLILRSDGTIAITDFGLARETGTGSMTESGAIVGTPMFMAPEQVLGDRMALGSRADVYGLGATLYNLVTGRPPFSGPTAQSVLKQVLDVDPPRPSKFRAELPAPLEAIILKAMSKDPARRYGAAQEMADDLDRFLCGERVHARRPGPLQRTWHALGRHPLLTTLCAIILALTFGALELYRGLERGRLDAELANAERSLAQAFGRIDERMQRLGPDERDSLLHLAIAHASNVIAMRNDHGRAWFVRAKARHQLMDYEGAMADLDAATRLGGASQETLLYRIDTASRLHAWETLRSDLRKLLDRDQGDHNLCIVARHLLTMASHLPDDERFATLDGVEEIVEMIDRPDGSAMVARARLHELRGDAEGALRTIREACVLFQGNLLVHAEAASMLHRLGRYAEGQAEAERARMIDPDYGVVESSPEADPTVDVDAMHGFLEELESLVRTVRRAPRDRG